MNRFFFSRIWWWHWKTFMSTYIFWICY